MFLNTPVLMDQHWPAARELLEPVVSQAARGEFTTEDLHGLLVERRAHAVVVFSDGLAHLAMVFEFRLYPRKQVINVMAVGGHDLTGAAVSFWPEFVAWAKESGTDEIEACTAPAMTRVLRHLGFTHTYDIVRLACH